MAQFSSKELIIKIVYYGNQHAGKTSNLRWLYDHLEVPTKKWHEEDIIQEELCGFEYSLSEDFCGKSKCRCSVRRVGPELLSHTWVKEFLQNIDGMIVVVDSRINCAQENQAALALLERILQEKNYSLTDLTLVFQWNKQDLGNIEKVDDLEFILNHYKAESHTAIANTGEGVQECFNLALNKIRTKIQTGTAQQRMPKPADIVQKVRTRQGDVSHDKSITGKLSQKVLPKTSAQLKQMQKKSSSSPIPNPTQENLGNTPNNATSLEQDTPNNPPNNLTDSIQDTPNNLSQSKIGLPNTLIPNKSNPSSTPNKLPNSLQSTKSSPPVKPSNTKLPTTISTQIQHRADETGDTTFDSKDSKQSLSTADSKDSKQSPSTADSKDSKQSLSTADSKDSKQSLSTADSKDSKQSPSTADSKDSKPLSPPPNIKSPKILLATPVNSQNIKPPYVPVENTKAKEILAETNQDATTDSPTDVDIHIEDANQLTNASGQTSQKNNKVAESAEETQKISIKADGRPEENFQEDELPPPEEQLPISLADKAKAVSQIHNQQLNTMKDVSSKTSPNNRDTVNVTDDLDLFSSQIPSNISARPPSLPTTASKVDPPTTIDMLASSNTSVLARNSTVIVGGEKTKTLTTKDVSEAISGLQQGRVLHQCTLAELNLSRQIFHYPVRIENCVIEKLILSGADFHAAIILDNTTITKEFNAGGEHATTFRDQLLFKRTTVNAEVVLGHSRVHKLIFMDSKIGKTISMKNGICENGILITNSQLCGIQIEATQFRGPVSISGNTKSSETILFHNCIMEDSCSFNSLQAVRLDLEKNTFWRKLELLVCNIDKNVSWQECVCYGPVLMTDCLFAGTLNGQKSQFHNSLNIRKTSFYQDTSLSKITCYGNCLLEEVTYFSIADFSSASFQTLRIVKCTFNGSTNFQESTFYGVASILDTQIKQQLNLCHSIWFHKLDLKETEFGGPISFAGLMADFVVVNRNQIEGHLASAKANDYETMYLEYQILEQIFSRQHQIEDKNWAHIQAQRAGRKKQRFSLLHPFRNLAKIAEYWLLDFGTGYGTKPMNMLFIATFIILFFAGIYSFLPVLPQEYQMAKPFVSIQGIPDDYSWLNPIQPYIENTLTSLLVFLPSGTRCWSLPPSATQSTGSASDKSASDKSAVFQISITQIPGYVPHFLMMLENLLGWIFLIFFLLICLRKLFR